LFRSFTMFTSSILISIFPLFRNFVLLNPMTKFKATVNKSSRIQKRATKVGTSTFCLIVKQPLRHLMVFRNAPN